MIASDGKAAALGGDEGSRQSVSSEKNQKQSTSSTPLLQIEVPTGGLFFDVEDGDGFAEFTRTAHIGDALQSIFAPTPISRRGIISTRDLLAIHRVHSEADLCLVKGFDRFLAVLDVETLLEISEGGGR